MALQIAILYQDRPLTYEINIQEEDIYIFRLNDTYTQTEKYIPEKLVIRRKGKLWVSDLENHEELVNALIREIGNFNNNVDSGNQEKNHNSH